VIQLQILSGKKAGVSWTTRRFPVRIGRAPSSDLQLEEDGVWDQHIVLQFKPGEGYVIRALGDATTRVNGDPVQGAVLRNGDTIQIGSVQAQFWLGEARRVSLVLRETITWLLVAGVTACQVVLLYWLLR
jgi:pSer/pThr/pTyr-binding forkhead associated (FHA) protein